MRGKPRLVGAANGDLVSMSHNTVLILFSSVVALVWRRLAFATGFAIRFSELANTPHSPIAISLQRNGKAPHSPMANERRMHLLKRMANGEG